MVWSEFVREVQRELPGTGDDQLRNLIRTGKLKKPALDGSLSFRFSENDVLLAVFALVSQQVAKNGARCHA